MSAVEQVIKKLVDRGLAITAEISRLEAEKKRLTIQLEGAALIGEQVDLADDEREGKQFLARGTALTVPVIISADEIVKSFDEGGPLYERLNEAVGKARLSLLYKRVVTWKALFAGGKEMRQLAAEQLGELAPAFVTACVKRDKNGLPKNKITVEWGRAKDHDAVSGGEGA